MATGGDGDSSPAPVSIRSFARSGLRHDGRDLGQGAEHWFLFALSRDQVFDAAARRGLGLERFLFALSRDQVFDYAHSCRPSWRST